MRPDDSRYGENPNRLQTHTQLQVILKPEPGNPQELYLGSLTALGIDVAAHDVRFVEDNWASPALGAWGLGWEVWLDGLEITQFTYFQQAGGVNLDPPSVEITYGIERIIMALQDVRHFKDIAYAPGVSYGEVFGQAEYEMSRYYLDDADVAANRQLLELYAGRGPADDRRRPAGARAHVRAEVLARVQRARLPRRGLHRRAGRRVRPDAPAGRRGRPALDRQARRAGPPARRGRADRDRDARPAATADRRDRRPRSWSSRSAPRRCRRPRPAPPASRSGAS